MRGEECGNFLLQRVQIGGVRCDTMLAESAEIHDTCVRPRECVCGQHVQYGRTRTRMQQLQQLHQSQQLQQPEGWRFVPDTILLGYQWAPQWVPARTPTVHWGPISGKAVGGPLTV